MHNVEKKVIELIANVAEVDEGSINLTSDLILDVKIYDKDFTVNYIKEYE